MRLKESVDNLLGMTDSRFAHSFYDQLLGEYPELQPRFAKTRWAWQRMMFMMSLQLIAYYYRNPNPSMKMYLMGLGAQHREKGIDTADYPKWRDVLIKVLRDEHGDDWSTELEAEWTQAVDSAISLMIEGAEHLHNESEHSWVY